MGTYGILKTATNTGLSSELLAQFSAPLSIISNKPAFVSDTLSLRRLTQSKKAQRWEIEANLVPSRDDTSLLVHLVTNGITTPFYIRMPQLYTTAKMPAGYSLTVSAVANAGTNLINISGISGTLIKKGEFITFQSDPKVYLITDPGSGGVGVQVFPELRTTKSIGTTIKYGDNVTMTAVFDTSTQSGIKYVDGILQDIGTVRFVESL